MDGSVDWDEVLKLLGFSLPFVLLLRLMYISMYIFMERCNLYVFMERMFSVYELFVFGQPR